MLEETHDDGVIVERVAALDIGKAEVVCCVRVPSPGQAATGRAGRSQEVRTYPTMTRSLAAMGDWLHGGGDPGDRHEHVGAVRRLRAGVLPVALRELRLLAGA